MPKTAANAELLAALKRCLYQVEVTHFNRQCDLSASAAAEVKEAMDEANAAIAKASANLAPSYDDLLAERDRLKASNAELLLVLETIKYVADVPQHKKDDVEFLRATATICHEEARAAIAKAEQKL